MTSTSAPGRTTPLQVVYGAFAAVGLVAVVAAAAGVDGPTFVDEVFSSPATTTVALDLLVLGFAVLVFMVVEAVRLGMRRPWAWAVLGLVLPGAFLAPLFLLLRERRLAS